jgi:AraC-like DNA-binding protein
MKYVFLIAAFNALFFAVLLLQKKPKALHDKILFYWLIYLGLFTAFYTFSFHELVIQIKHISGFIISMFLLHGPFLYLYVESLTSGKKQLTQKGLFHFIPFFSFLLYLLISLWFPEYSSRIRMDHVTINVEPPFIFVLFLFITALSGPVYFIASYLKFKNVNKNILNIFSTTEEINLDWLKTLVYIFGIIWSALIVVAIVHHLFHYASMAFCTDGLFLSLSAFIILVGYFGLRQKEIFTKFPTDDHDFVTDQRTKYQNMPLSELEFSEIIGRLNTTMEHDKLFLNPEITLPELAKSIDIPSYQLSRIINEKFECNFFDFINGYRVNEVKSKLNDPTFSNLSLLGIAFDSGFNSKSAFNRIFKKTTGLTPSEFKKINQSL